MGSNANAVHREPKNKGKFVGQRTPFKLKDLWALRVRLQMENQVRELAIFNLGIDSNSPGLRPRQPQEPIDLENTSRNLFPLDRRRRLA